MAIRNGAGRLPRSSALDAWFWRHCAEATLCVSPECQRQVETITGGRNGPIFQFRSQFYPDDFLSVAPPPPHDERPFRVIFVGRVQREKGVFDVVEIADRLERKYPGRLRYEVCGSGSDLEELKQAIEGRGLGEVVKVMGPLKRPELLAAYGRSHVLIVPTRSTFCEGMPATAAEGVLTGRPVLTSRLSNALDVLEGAVVEARPDDLDSYIEGLERLMTDGDYYRQCCEACPASVPNSTTGTAGSPRPWDVRLLRRAGEGNPSTTLAYIRSRDRPININEYT